MSDDLEDALLRALNTRSWEETRALLGARPELHGPAAIGILAALRDAEMDRARRAYLEEHLALFRRCAERGTFEAFAERDAPQLGSGGGNAATEADLAPTLAAIELLQEDPARSGEMAELCERALLLAPRSADPHLWAALQGTRADALQARGASTADHADLHAAVAGYDAALEVLTRQDRPLDWATVLQNRASALARLGSLAGSPTILRASVAAYEAALEVFVAAGLEVDATAIRTNLAAALDRLGSMKGGARHH